MRLPWVSRDAYELALTHIAMLEGQLTLEQKRSAFTLDTVLSLKVSGAQTMRPITTTVAGERVRPPRSDVQQAIDENKHASANPRLRQHLTKWAQKQLDANADREKVLNQLRAWSVVSTEDD